MVMEEISLFMQIFIINLLLSGDNAVVIALASRPLSEKDRIRAVWWGTMIAIVLRLLLIFIAVILLKIPFIQMFGSICLIWIALKLMKEEQQASHIAEAKTLRSAIWTILIADLIMSLDNVLAIAAKGYEHPVIMILGIALCIPMMIWGSQFMLNVLKYFPAILYVGAGILGFTAGEMLIHEPFIEQWLMIRGDFWLKVIPWMIMIFVIIYGEFLKKKNKNI
jgi:YjbE family integral membrane protein